MNTLLTEAPANDEDRVKFSSLRFVLKAVPRVLSNLMPFLTAEMGAGMA